MRKTVAGQVKKLKYLGLVVAGSLVFIGCSNQAGDVATKNDIEKLSEQIQKVSKAQLDMEKKTQQMLVDNVEMLDLAEHEFEITGQRFDGTGFWATRKLNNGLKEEVYLTAELMEQHELELFDKVQLTLNQDGDLISVNGTDL